MNSAIELTLAQSFDFLLHVAVVRPVFLWGAPGIGKTALVNRFAAAVGLECVSLLGSRLAPDSYARPARRQSSNREIPRPSILKPREEERQARVFGVVLDTSGSMEPKLLGKAIGAIASYAQAREVFWVR